MKFFARIGCASGCILGPFEDTAAVQAEMQRLYPYDKKSRFVVFDGEVIRVTPSPKEKPENEKRQPGDMGSYEKRGDEYFCKTCDGPILAVRVAHPVHFQEMPGVGGGECQYTDAPYCPNCEHEPSCQGEPVQVPMFGQ